MLPARGRMKGADVSRRPVKLFSNKVSEGERVAQFLYGSEAGFFLGHIGTRDKTRHLSSRRDSRGCP